MRNEIYKITNKENSKIYIGLTIQGTRTRYLHHLYEARSGSNFPIHRAIRKYGEHNFEVEVIKSIEASEELKELEKFYIKELKANNRKFGYNLTEGGDGTLGKKHSEKTKEKIRQKAIGRIYSEETRQRQRDAASKVKNEDWYKENKRKAALIGNAKRSRKLEVLNIKTNEIIIFNSIKECSEKLDIPASSIHRILKTESKKHSNYLINLCQI